MRGLLEEPDMRNGAQGARCQNSAQGMQSSPPLVPPWLAMLAALLAVSTAAPLVRLAPDVPPISAGFWRVAIVALILAPTLRGRVPRARYLLPTALAGLLLATHFWSWFEAIQRTTVLRATLLVCLNPVWTSLGERMLLGRRPGLRYWSGLAIAILGVVLMSLPGASTSSMAASWSGDVLALIGGVFGSAYMLIGRVIRQRVDIGPYGALVCASAGAWLALFAALTGASLLGFSRDSWLVLTAMALGPQLLGHIGVNYALRWIPAAVVAALLLLEPVGAAAIGGVVLAEWPSNVEMAGAAVVLAGLGAAVVPWGERGPPQHAGPAPPT